MLFLNVSQAFKNTANSLNQHFEYNIIIRLENLVLPNEFYLSRFFTFLEK